MIHEQDTITGKRSFIEIIAIQDSDYGHYNCTVVNSYGTDTLIVKLQKKGKGLGKSKCKRSTKGPRKVFIVYGIYSILWA